MVLEVTKKVRVSRQVARRLAALARQRHTSESQVIRDAILQLHDQQSREAAVEKLIEMTKDQTYEKEEFWLK